MNILVIDNTPAQLAAAKTQLEVLEHDVTCISSFNELTMIMMGTDRGLRACEPKGNFDVVLTDLFMPASSSGLASYREESDGGIANSTRPYFEDVYYDEKKREVVAVPNPTAPEVPYGIIIAMVAAMAGAKKVGIVSLGDHHGGPVAWAMDALEHSPLLTERDRYDRETGKSVRYDHFFPQNEEEERWAGEGKKPFVRTFTVNGAKVAFFTGYGCPSNRIGGEKIKNWAAALERLMEL